MGGYPPLANIRPRPRVAGLAWQGVFVTPRCIPPTQRATATFVACITRVMPAPWNPRQGFALEPTKGAFRLLWKP
jgi:hypothetical protein